MHSFDGQYYFICFHDDDRLPILAPDMDTAAKPFMSQRLPTGQKPLIFYNSSLNWQKQYGITPTNTPPDILFHGADVIVKGDARDKLLGHNIPGLAMHMAIFIDHNDDWHEDYWHLTFTEMFDCWDRKHSKYDHDPEQFADSINVYTYSLDDDVLKSTPIEKRRLFKMGNTSAGMIVVHQSIADLFRGTGADLIPIADYGVTYP